LAGFKVSLLAFITNLKGYEDLAFENSLEKKLLGFSWVFFLNSLFFSISFKKTCKYKEMA